MWFIKLHLGSFSGKWHYLVFWLINSVGMRFYLLLFTVAGCIFCCYMTHLGVLRLERKNYKQLITNLSKWAK